MIRLHASIMAVATCVALISFIQLIDYGADL